MCGRLAKSAEVNSTVKLLRPDVAAETSAPTPTSTQSKRFFLYFFFTYKFGWIFVVSVLSFALRLVFFFFCAFPCVLSSSASLPFANSCW